MKVFDTSNDEEPEDFCGEVSLPYIEVGCSNLLCYAKCLIPPGDLDVKTRVFCSQCYDLINGGEENEGS